MRSGGTPNLACTPATSSVSLLMVLTSVTCSFTSCARSLSPVETIERMPRSAACFVKVPMTSSASTPSMTMSGQPIALIASNSGGTCALSSSGIAARLALYSAYSSSRKVLPRGSNTQARKSAL